VLDRQSLSSRNADMETRYKAGTVGMEEFANFYVGTLVGRGPDDWEPMRREFLQSMVVPRIGQAAKDLVKQHLDAGDLVVMTTATNRFITELTAQYFGIADLIATEPQLHDGCFTGRTAGTLNMREGKVERLHAWLGQAKRSLADFESTAYSDSINDLPLLCAVQQAVAVNPDERLRSHAQSNGWRVIQLAR